jgi:iron-sulfur cluster repair protein YtfE (RIC family)
MQPLPTSPTPSSGPKNRLPTLFGRLSILLDAHERHMATLESLRQMSDAIEIGQDLPAALAPSRLLGALQRELSSHFAAEEGRAHYRTIARTRTDLLPRVVDLKADHTGLLRTLSHIELIATDTGRWTELPALVSNLLGALADHERAEAELVEDFLSPGEDAPERSEVRATGRLGNVERRVG